MWRYTGDVTNDGSNPSEIIRVPIASIAGQAPNIYVTHLYFLPRAICTGKLSAYVTTARDSPVAGLINRRPFWGTAPISWDGMMRCQRDDYLVMRVHDGTAANKYLVGVQIEFY